MRSRPRPDDALTSAARRCRPTCWSTLVADQTAWRPGRGAVVVVLTVTIAAASPPRRQFEPRPRRPRRQLIELAGSNPSDAGPRSPLDTGILGPPVDGDATVPGVGAGRRGAAGRPAEDPLPATLAAPRHRSTVRRLDEQADSNRAAAEQRGAPRCATSVAVRPMSLFAFVPRPCLVRSVTDGESERTDGSSRPSGRRTAPARAGSPGRRDPLPGGRRSDRVRPPPSGERRPPAGRRARAARGPAGPGAEARPGQVVHEHPRAPVDRRRPLRRERQPCAAGTGSPCCGRSRSRGSARPRLASCGRA